MTVHEYIIPHVLVFRQHNGDDPPRADKGIAMGSPISGTVAEIFLQHLEKTHIKNLIDSKHLIFYARYVDDIFIIYDSSLTSPTKIQHYMDTIHDNIKLNATHETNDTVNFLDLSITRKSTSLELDIYRKLTSTDTTINFLFQPPPRAKTCSLQILHKQNAVPPL